MRMWMVRPAIMCRKHLLGEHVELHMFVSHINAGKSLAGYIDNNLVEVPSIRKRHAELAKEMRRRGYNHASPLPAVAYEYRRLYNRTGVTRGAALQELLRRCPECRRRHSKTRNRKRNDPCIS